MNIALLGSGAIMKELAASIMKEGHHIIAVGTNVNADVDGWKLDDFGIKPFIIQNYSEVCSMDIELVLMFSYAPLIQEKYLSLKKFVNVHYAVLPRFRGMHGFIWSMINDEKVMGYTLHQAEAGIDNGPVYFQYCTQITDDQDINDVRSVLDKNLILNIGKYVTQIEHGLIPIPQDESKAIYVTKRRAEDGEINWEWDSRLVFNHIRGLTPPATPGAYSYINKQKIIFTKAKYVNSEKYYSDVGKIVNIDQNTGAIYVKCNDKPIMITEIMIENKRLIPIECLKKVGIQFIKNHGNCYNQSQN